MATRHLSQIDLAACWNISHRTLERLRRLAEGPKLIKLGGRVIYRLEDVEAFEAEQSAACHEPHCPMSASRGGNIKISYCVTLADIHRMLATRSQVYPPISQRC